MAQSIIALALVALAAAFLARRVWRTRGAGCASSGCRCPAGLKVPAHPKPRR